MSYELDKVLFFRSIDNKDFPTLSNLLIKHPGLIYEDDDNIFSVPSYCIVNCFECLQFIFQFYTENRQKFTLDRNFLTILNIDGSSALHTAVELQHKEAVSFLLQNGLAPNIQNFTGDTPLNELTLYSNNIEIAKLLLIFGSDVNIGNNYNMSPLRRAISMEKVDLIQLYLRYGGNLYGYKTKKNSKIIEDDWLDVILPMKSEEIQFILKEWLKQQRRKASSISKKLKKNKKQKDLEKQYVSLCEEARKIPLNILYNFARKNNIDTNDKSKDQICEELSTKILAKRNLMNLK